MAKDKQIARLLKADISMTSDLSQIAKMLEKKGRGGDTMLAHITRREAEMLKDMGGAGTINPETGLLEFYDGEGFDATSTQSFLGTDQTAQAPSPQADTTQIPQNMGQFESFTAPTVGNYSPPATGSSYGLQAPTLPAATSGGVGEGVVASPSVIAPNVTVPASPAYGLTTKYTPELETSPAPQEKSFLDKLSTQDLVRLGLAGGLGLVGRQQAQKAAAQSQQAQAEQQALATPYQQQGQAMVGAAQRGELTPAAQQSLQAMRAQVAQGVENRGGVGAAQAEAQVEAFRQQLLQQQYNYGLQVAQIGDSIALGAIKTGLQADQQVQQATNQFYTQLASIAGGLPIYGTAR